MQSFISKKCSIYHKTVIGLNVKIFGPSIIRANTYLDDYITIGYPVRMKIREAIKKNANGSLDSLLDELSDGSYIGEGCIIRRSSIIYERVSIGNNVELGHNVVIRENSMIKDSCRIGTNTIIDGEAYIGSNTIVQSNVYIPPKVRIGSNVFIAPRVVFTNDRYPPSKRIIETIVEDDVVIGANSTIIAGIVIGKGAVIAAGAVVTKSIEPYTVVAGVPAKPIMDREEYEKRKRLYESMMYFPLK